MILSLICAHCSIHFQRKVYKSSNTPKRTYCSDTCRKNSKLHIATWTQERRQEYSKKFSGENNPNFGNNWTDEQKQKASAYRTEFFKQNPEIAYACGKSNRGVKFSQERIDKMHSHRSKDSYSHKASEETKKRIGKKSKEKWTDEYKEKHKQKMILLGHWQDPKDEPYKFYYRDSNWIGSMIEFLNEEDLQKFKEKGFYNKKDNTQGLVRDHIVSRKHGYTFNLPSCIIRHPENLQLITHAENVSKGFRDRKLSVDEIRAEIENLLTRILNTTIQWSEQDSCIAYIMQRKEVV